MDIKKITAKFKSMTQKLNEEVKAEEVVEELEIKEATLTDGTIIQYDKLEVGGVVMAITEEGEVPAPDATHQLEDGTLITTVDGVITEVVEGAPMAEEEEMFNAEQEFSTLKMENETLKQEIESLKAQILEIPNILKEMAGTLEQVEKIVEMASQEPSQPAAEKPKQVSVKSFRSAFN